MNQAAIDFIKAHEGCKLTAYLDSGGVPTIGFGATGPDIKLGLTWTQKQADDRLIADTNKAEASARKLITRLQSEKQMAAVISFVFNLGAGALASSHLLVVLNSGDALSVGHEFSRWDHVGQMEVKGLLIRRLEEAALYLRGSP